MPVKITITFWDPVDPEAFEHHYVGTHAPLVRKLPGLRGYEYGRAFYQLRRVGSRRVLGGVCSRSMTPTRCTLSFASPAGRKTTEDMSNFITGPMKSIVSEVR